MSQFEKILRRLLAHGVEFVVIGGYAAVTHGVLCGDAIKRITDSAVKELVITDSIPHAPGTLPPKIRMLSVAPLLAEAIRRIHDEESLSSLFI